MHFSNEMYDLGMFGGLRELGHSDKEVTGSICGDEEQQRIKARVSALRSPETR